MTPRARYYCDRHLERIAKRIKRYLLPCVSGTSIIAMLKECYSFSLYGKDRAKYNLIERYEGKVSAQLRFDKKQLRKKGEEQSKEEWRQLFNRPNPLLAMIGKSEFIGKYMPVPLVYHDT